MTLKIHKIFYLIILLSPIWWLTGFNLFIYHLFAFFVFIVTFLGWGNIPLRFFYYPVEIRFLLLFVLIYCFSLFINIVDSEFNRLLASLYNLTYWVMGLVVSVYLFLFFDAKLWGSIVKASIIALYAVLILVYLSILLNTQLVDLPSLLSLLFGDSGSIPALVYDSITVSFVKHDYIFGDETYRVTVMSPYPTALAGSLILLLSIYLSAIKNYNLKVWFLIALTIFAVVSTNSRVGVVALAMYLFLYFYFQIPENFNKIFLALFLTLCLIIFTIFFYDLFLDWFFNVLEAREGSSNLRSYIYLESYNYWINDHFWFGSSIKPRGLVENPYGSHEIPIGSHSTWLGLLVKTGVVGTSFVLMIFLAILKKVVLETFVRIKLEQIVNHRIYTSMLSVIFVFFSVFFIFEDLDAPQFMSFLFFICYGAMLGIKNTKIGLMKSCSRNIKTYSSK